MKLDRAYSEVTRSNVKSESTFNIQTSAHAFEILSSGLYTDAITAIVRELSCNAYDSHVAAGNQSKPFDIHIPSRMEPCFSIRDYGTGLSHEDIIGVYTTYFQSTKSDSNDFIGALGLGSKSPFSHTDNFTVTSYFEGTAYRYAVCLNEEGVPTVALMGEVDADEPSGLEITIPSDNKHEFLDAVSKNLAYFTVRPNVSGISSEEIDSLYGDIIEKKDSELNEEGKWFLSNRERFGNYRPVGIIYGQVPYPLDAGAVFRNLREICSEEVINFYREFSHQLVFIFKIGELSITANREEIKYDDATVQILAERLTAIYDKYFARVKTAIEEFADNDSIYKTNRYLLTEVFNNESKFFQLIDFEKIDCPAYCKMEDSRSPYSGLFGRTVANVMHEIVEARLYTALYLESYTSKSTGDYKIRANKNKHASCLGISCEIFYYLVDESRNGVEKAKQHFETLERKRTSRYVILKPTVAKQCHDAVYQEELAEIIEALGNPDIIRTSTLSYTAPIKNKSTASRALQGTTYCNAPFWQGTRNLDFEKGGAYLYLARGTRVYKGSKQTEENSLDMLNDSDGVAFQALANIFNLATGSDLEPSDVIGVTAADIKLFDDSAQWVNIIDVVQAYVRGNKDELCERIIMHNSVKTSYDNIGVDTVRNIGYVTDMLLFLACCYPTDNNLQDMMGKLDADNLSLIHI